MVFYGPQIRNEGYRYLVYDCDNKSNVLELAELVVSKSSRLSDCLFFVDRDLDLYLDKPYVITSGARRTFVTSFYSIESYVSDDASLDLLFLELSGVTAHASFFSQKADLLRDGRALFDALRFLSALVLISRRKGYRINLNNFSISRIVRVLGPDLVVRPRYWRQFLADVGLNDQSFAAAEVRSVLKELGPSEVQRWARGKYLVEVFFLLFKAMIPRVQKHCGKKGFVGKKVKVIDVQSWRAMFVLLCLRLQVPNDLQKFLQATLK